MNQTLTKLAACLSFSSLDSCWQDIYEQSMVGKLWLNFKLIVQSVINRNSILSQHSKQIGAVLDWLAFIVILALCLALGMKQFANDKEGLAIFILAGCLLQLLSSFFKTKKSFQGNFLDVIVLVYLGTNIIATFSSHYFLAAVKGLIKVIIYIAGYFLFRATMDNVQSQKRIIAIVSCLIASGFVVALYGFYQYKIGVAPLATWEDPTVEIKATRIYSTLGNPNLLAGYLLPLLPLSLTLAINFLLNKRFWLWAVFSVTTLFFAIAVVLTGSRGGYIGLAVTIVMLMLTILGRLWHKKPRFRLMILVGGLLFVILFAAIVHFVPTIDQRVMSIFAGGEHTSNRYRLNVWHSSINMIKDSWLFGVGPGNQAFRLAYGLYMISGFDALGTYSLPLEVWVEAGILGFIAFIVLVAAAFACAHINYHQGQNKLERYLSLGCAAALAGLMAHGMVDTIFFRPQVQIIFWIVIATLFALNRQVNSKVKI